MRNTGAILLTSTLIVDARLVARACVVAATSNVAHAIVTYLIRDAMIVAVAYCLADTAVAPLVAQAVCIAETIERII